MNRILVKIKPKIGKAAEEIAGAIKLKTKTQVGS